MSSLEKAISSVSQKAINFFLILQEKIIDFSIYSFINSHFTDFKLIIVRYTFIPHFLSEILTKHLMMRRINSGNMHYIFFIL